MSRKINAVLLYRVDIWCFCFLPCVGCGNFAILFLIVLKEASNVLFLRKNL